MARKIKKSNNKISITDASNPAKSIEADAIEVEETKTYLIAKQTLIDRRAQLVEEIAEIDALLAD